MTITITRKDWKRGLDHDKPCGCLLHRAIKRQTGKRGIVWMYGRVQMPDREYRYSRVIHEARLQAAHRDPSLLPITIVLR